MPCPCKVKHDEEKYNAQLITHHHMQRDTLNAKLKDIYLKGKRLEVARAADDICNRLQIKMLISRACITW